MTAFTAAVLALLAGASSSSAQSSSEHIWASVGWVLHGERTPLFGATPPSLTPVGAQQMFAQGDLLRTRYLSRFTDSDDDGVDRHAPIVGIEANAIDNTQLSIITNTDQYMVTSAMAFIQGLYPPINQAFSENSGGMAAAQLANGSVVNYPLGGYQYPSIRTASILDFESVWYVRRCTDIQGMAVLTHYNRIGGNVGCTSYTESLLNFRNDTIIATVYNNTINFYQNLWRQLLNKAFPQSMANFGNAYLLYDYASFQYTHDNETRENITEGEMNMMARFAATEQRNKNANLSVSGSTEGDMIRAVAGRTMASKTVALFIESIRSGGSTNKLNLAFTSFEPFVAFFALSKLVVGNHAAEFKPLPEPGAVMLFELFSIGGGDTEFPSTDKLWVRFLYRNGTDPGDELTTYSIFGNSETRMPFNKFAKAVQEFGIGTISEWCRVCDSVSLFCQGLSSSIGSGSSPSPFAGSDHTGAVSPAIAGVIGAAVTIAVVGIAVLAAILMGGIRFHRADPKARNTTLGGFKGAEKMASDTDIAYVKSGSRHERTGSWELRGGGKETDVKQSVTHADTPSTTKVGVTVQARDLTHPSKKDIDDDAISEMGHSPVDPREF
ncbi:histidine phosphatase superfamily [Lasiosphaeris hirsuta]|uniref:Histidine phosphatase superfamily n=1 Tax=Lasiosphaeris hirsuta TaxID=260670 RepID=A0AA39ZWY7_9PEZI|nr:histidine phosphatase superfamily [Lasiosphaeris hirsuta]